MVNKAEADVFLELSCFFHDPADLGNLISGSSAFSKSSLNIWRFSVHILLKPGLENFEHFFASIWDNASNRAVVWACFGFAFLWDWIEKWPFPVLWPLLSFPNCWHVECSTFTASSFRIWNSSTGIPSPPLTLFVVMLPKAHLTLRSRMSGSRWVITPSWLSVSWRSFLPLFLGLKVPPCSWLAYFNLKRVTTLSDMGKQTLGGHKQNLVCTRTQEKGAVTWQETDPALPGSVQESPAQAWVSGGLVKGWGHWV